MPDTAGSFTALEKGKPTLSGVEAARDPRGQDPQRLLRGLNTAQADAVQSSANPLRILAGAGSGKTRVLTHRIAYRAAEGSEDPTKVLAVTFTRKAARELRDRLSKLGIREGVRAGTFHAVAYAQLRQRWEEKGVRPPELLDRKLSFLARIMRSRNSTLPLDVIAEIEWASARLVSPASYETAANSARRSPPLELARVADIYKKYQDAKLKKRVVDFDDILRLAARDLQADPVYAGARRWRYRHIYVDEFQDVNPLQNQLLKLWMGAESSLCVVGDPNQAIYAWNGADAGYLMDFETHYASGPSALAEETAKNLEAAQGPEAQMPEPEQVLDLAQPAGSAQQSETVRLTENYRSTPEILTAANAVLAGSPARLKLTPTRQSGSPPHIEAFNDETAEAKAIARRCRRCHKPNGRWSAQAVLVRTNSQAAVIAEALSAAQIPHRVRGATSLLEQPEVKDALRMLRNSLSVSGFTTDLEQLLRSDDSALTEERKANVAELIRLGAEFLSMESEGTTEGFSRWLYSALRSDDAVGSDAVEIATFHSSKGLEWSVVHVAGLEKGFVPIHHSRDDPEAVEEERRLLYVALTRASDELYCTWAQTRAFGTRTLSRTESPWLSTIEDIRDGAKALNRRSKAPRAGRAKSKRGDINYSPAENALFEQLRQWRLKRAQAADVPAFVILNDSTLRAIASSRPKTATRLLDQPGIGAVKADRFGKEILEIVKDSDA